MRQIKTRGGLCQGRGVSDASLSKWICAIPYCHLISENVEDFCGVKNYSCAQHKDLTESRRKRDHDDQDKLIDFFNNHNPLKIRNEAGIDKTLCSVVTGIVAGNDVNCYKAESIGIRLMKSIIGQNFQDLKLKRNDKVKSLSRNVIKIRGESVVINPKQLFNRIVCTATSTEQLRECFEYEHIQVS